MTRAVTRIGILRDVSHLELYGATDVGLDGWRVDPPSSGAVIEEEWV